MFTCTELQFPDFSWRALTTITDEACDQISILRGVNLDMETAQGLGFSAIGNHLCRNAGSSPEEAATSTAKEAGTDLARCSLLWPDMSSRIQSMLKSRSKFTDKTEFETECSKVHWSELDPPSDSDAEYSPESDRVYSDEVLKKHQD